MTPMIDEEIVYTQNTQKHAPFKKNRKHVYKILSLFLIFSNLVFLGFFTYNEFFLVKKPTNFPEKNETDNFFSENVLILQNIENLVNESTGQQNKILENLVNESTGQLKFISENIFKKIVDESGQSFELQHKILDELKSPSNYEQILNKTNLNLIKIINSQFGDTFKINIVTDLAHRVQSAYASILLPQILNTISSEMLQLKSNQEYVLKQYFTSILQQNQDFLNNLLKNKSFSSSNFSDFSNDTALHRLPVAGSSAIISGSNNGTDEMYVDN
jgi:hypothetical protein